MPKSTRKHINGVLMVGHAHNHRDTYMKGIVGDNLKQITCHVLCSIGLSLVPCSYGHVACSARHYIHKAYTLGVLGALRCYVVDIWPTFLYGLAVLRSYDSNRGQFHSLGGVTALVNTLVHICRHYGVSTNALRQSKVYFLETHIYMCWYMAAYAHIYRNNWSSQYAKYYGLGNWCELRRLKRQQQ